MAKIGFIISMLIFGTIGLFVKAIGLSSTFIVMMRSIIGGIFLFSIVLVRKQPIDKVAIRKNLPLLSLAGVILGGNWAFLFQAYQYTTVSIATIVYYFAPVIIFILSPIIFKERFTLNKIIGISVSVLGMIIINNINVGGSNPFLGLLCGFISAVLYASVTILNKFLTELSSIDSTLIQLIVASIVMGIYVFAKKEFPTGSISLKSGILIIIVGILHTGVACYLYFSSVKKLPAQTSAMLSYIDPTSALLFSAIFFHERLSAIQIIGAFMILGGTALSQIPFPQRNSKITSESDFNIKIKP